MIYKVADSYLTNTNPFLNTDETTYCELRKSPSYNVGIIGTFNDSELTYSFDVLEDGYYKLFTFTKKVKSIDYNGSETVTTYEKGNIQEETTFPLSYIDVKQTGSPKIYKALLTQSSEEEPPVATVLENTLGIVEYSRGGAGDYLIASSTLFTSGKTIVSPLYSYNENDHKFYLVLVDESNITLNTYSGGDRVDNLLTNYPISIEVYP